MAIKKFIPSKLKSLSLRYLLYGCLILVYIAALFTLFGVSGQQEALLQDVASSWIKAPSAQVPNGFEGIVLTAAGRSKTIGNVDQNMGVVTLSQSGTQVDFFYNKPAVTLIHVVFGFCVVVALGMEFIIFFAAPPVEVKKAAKQPASNSQTSPKARALTMQDIRLGSELPDDADLDEETIEKWVNELMGKASL